MNNVKQINTDTFNEQVELAKGFVLVDFFAEWCAPCKIIAPIVQAIAEDFNHLKVLKIDSDSAQAITRQFGIRANPTLLLFKDGKVIASKVGALSKTQLHAFITEHCDF